MAKLDRYKVTFSALGVPDAVALMDATPAQITGGYGGWTVVPRERRVSLTQFQGKDPLRMAIPILFEGVANGKGQELQISHLSRMALPPSSDGEPPVVTISGLGVPTPGPTQWVIENLQWGTNVIWDFARDGTMARLRQDCIVNVLQYVAEDRFAFRDLLPGTKIGASKSGWPKKYAFKAGDTLQKIAARKEFYGDASKWKLIADANKIRDPRTVKVGRVLTLPSP